MTYLWIWGSITRSLTDNCSAFTYSSVQNVSKIYSCAQKTNKANLYICTSHRWLCVTSRWEGCPAVYFPETLSAAPGLLCCWSLRCSCCVGSISVTSGPRTLTSTFIPTWSSLVPCWERMTQETSVQVIHALLNSSLPFFPFPKGFKSYFW